MDHPEGASWDRADRVDFDSRGRQECWGAQISSDGGPLITFCARKDPRPIYGLWKPHGDALPNGNATQAS